MSQDRSTTNGSNPEATSSSLLEGVKAEDPLAWQRLLDLYSPLIYFWCRSSGMRPDDAADVLQEVFRAVSNGVARFRHDRPGDTFRGWLRVITRHKIRDYFRREGGQPQAAGGTDAQQKLMAIEADETESLAPRSPLPGFVRRALDLIRMQFEDRTWQAFWLTAVEGLPTADVAERLGMTAGAVRQAKYKVLRRLRQELGDFEE
ncbi:MAG: sigma-70 family RNA polymerase sigma factor [Planctomycetota bacterium]